MEEKQINIILAVVIVLCEHILNLIISYNVVRDHNHDHVFVIIILCKKTIGIQKLYNFFVGRLIGHELVRIMKINVLQKINMIVIKYVPIY